MNKIARFRIDLYFYGVSGVGNIIIPFNPAVESHKVAKTKNLVGMAYQYSIIGIDYIDYSDKKIKTIHYSDRATKRVFGTQKEWKVLSKSLAKIWGRGVGTKKFNERLEYIIGTDFFVEYRDVLVALDDIFAPEILRIFTDKETWEQACIENGLTRES